MTSNRQIVWREWWVPWALTSLFAGALATILDAALLQRSRSYFTGGFLAADVLETNGQTATFLAASLLADVSVVCPVTALVLWIAGRAGISNTFRFLTAVVAGLAPLAVTNFVDYELATYLGDAFDLRLMFDLVGGDFTEFLAVSSAHLTAFAVGGVVIAGAGILCWFWIRRRGSHDMVRSWPAPARVVVTLLATILVAASVTTALRRGSDALDNGLRRKPSGQWLGLLVNQASDFDGDGSGVLGRPPDMDLLNPKVHPFAVDMPANGVDEDGAAGDLASAWPAYRELPSVTGRWAHSPDVVLVVLESFRFDAVGSQVSGQPVTPVIDQLARRGISAQAAFSHNGYTVQARRHLFTGSLANLRAGTLIDDFNANGYETAYFSGQDESFGGAEYGVGFERAAVAYDARLDRDKRYSKFTTPGSLAVPNGLVVERIEHFLERRDPSKPLFLYVNFHDTHFPYHHDGIQPLLNHTAISQEDISPARVTELRATYLNTAANVDRAIGRVLEQVSRHRGRDPGVIVVGDHGESLFDEGFLGHGYALNDAQTRIPLVIANLPVALVEPIGQADLRDAIGAAMGRDGTTLTPTLERSSARTVFQYLGTIDRPAQIKLTGLESQIAYDFRGNKVRVDTGPWRSPNDLLPDDLARWRDLVNLWERMILSRIDGRQRAS